MTAYHIRYLDKNMGIIKSEAVYMRSLGDAKKSATRNATALTYKIEIGDIIDKPLAFRYAMGKWDEELIKTEKGNEM
ncbi:hypothetical protein AB4454_08370, partial [Vibrio artabrorum]|uniref:hypothetical protein n=1 Tax=Vibrio artabrorum TaxID=446374 RepID=UPI0035531E3C